MIGCGNFARRQHLPNLARMPEVRLAAVCDLDPDTVAHAAQHFGAGYGTTRIQRIVEDPDIDAVAVAVRDELQAELGSQILAAGKHLYVEKPAAQTGEEFAKLIRARDASGCYAAVGFQKRFAPAYRAFRRILEADDGPRNLYVRMADDAWRWAAGYPPGALIRHDACHLFDLLRLFTGSEITTVMCASGRPDDDALLLLFNSGVTATLLHSGHASMDFPKERFEAITKRGGAIFDDFVEVGSYGISGSPARQTFPLRSADSGDPVAECDGLSDFLTLRRHAWEAWRKKGGVPDVIPNFLRDQGWYESLRQFAISIREGSPGDHARLEDARAAFRVATAAEKSRSTRQPVVLDPNPSCQ